MTMTKLRGIKEQVQQHLHAKDDRKDFAVAFPGIKDSEDVAEFEQLRKEMEAAKGSRPSWREVRERFDRMAAGPDRYDHPMMLLPGRRVTA